MKRFVLVLLLLSSRVAFAQKVDVGKTDKADVETDSPGVTIVSDTIIQVDMEKVTILAPRDFKSKYDQALFWSLRRKVLKTYPYALEAARILIEVDNAISTMKKKERKKFLKEKEKELEERFEKPLKKMHVGEGKILIMLINRETGNNAFTLIKEIKGSVDAFYYQNLGKFWGYDLKEQYDPALNPDIEYIIKMIELVAPGYELKPLPE